MDQRWSILTDPEGYLKMVVEIASVLSSMQVYWDSVFLLPKTIIYDIERIFKKFLWSSGDTSKGKAKVAWSDVCMPKDQGGLGFKSLDLWNKTFNDGKEGKFSTNRMWKDVRGMSNKVEWNDIVWLTNYIPRHNFVLWMAIQNKLCTQDKLAKWYPNKTYCCSLCKKREIHMITCFLTVIMHAKDVWTRVKEKAKISVSATNWKDMVMEISIWKCKRSVWGTIRKLCFGAAVYYLWQERNRRIFGNAERSKD
ncbi:RNA-directed DNA polymerase, eukaryota, reverse transcriptase zinc-binding domain protein [Tanacetum coccineum]